jgi:glutamine cyclotransferase
MHIAVEVPLRLLTRNPKLEPMKKLLVAATTVLLVVIVSLIGMLVVLSNRSNIISDSGTLQYTYSIIHIYPHDTNAFTEGLIYAGGYLFESSGLYGNSTLRRVDISSGKVLQGILLGSQYFGEGITVVNNTIIQLTWREHVGFVYDKTSFALVRNFTYPTEGWGLTYNGTHLLMSDGSDNLYFLDPSTLQRVGQVQVHDGSTSVHNINELEYVNGDVYANIFLQQEIAVINPQTGQVKAWISLRGIQDTSGFSSDMVLNGIAYDVQNNRLFVTGKDWPSLFEIRVFPQK